MMHSLLHYEIFSVTVPLTRSNKKKLTMYEIYFHLWNLTIYDNLWNWLFMKFYFTYCFWSQICFQPSSLSLNTTRLPTSRWLLRWETHLHWWYHLHTTPFLVIVCGLHNILQCPTVFVSSWTMNTNQLTNTCSCSLTSFDSCLLQPSDAIIVLQEQENAK